MTHEEIIKNTLNIKSKRFDKESFLQSVDNLIDVVEGLEKEKDNAESKLAEFNKDKEIKNLEDKLNKTYKLSLFNMSEKEYDDNKLFMKKHYQSCHNGNTFIYTLSGTGIGCTIKVKCPVCGEEVDITDISNW